MVAKYVVTLEAGFIHVVDSRRVTFKTVSEFCQSIPDLAKRWAVTKILLDQRDSPRSLSSVERFRYASEIAAHFQGLKIACIQDFPLRDPSGFGEAVATNRGADLRIFSTPEEACEWLGVSPLRYDSASAPWG